MIDVTQGIGADAVWPRRAMGVELDSLVAVNAAADDAEAPEDDLVDEDDEDEDEDEDDDEDEDEDDEDDDEDDDDEDADDDAVS